MSKILGSSEHIFQYIMKRFISIILFSVFLLNLFAFTLWFQTSRYLIRREMVQKIKDHPDPSEVNILLVTSENMGRLKWTNDKKEFEYKGEMYDVIKITSTGDKIKIYCLNDALEEHLLSIYKAHHQSRKKKDKIINGTNNKYYPVVFGSLDSLTGFLFVFSEVNIKVNSNIPLPDFPPPKYC